MKTKLLLIMIITNIILGLSSVGFYNKFKKADAKYADELNNRRYYEALVGGATEDNRVLQLNISDLTHSNDSVIQELNETRKSLKIKDNALKQALSNTTVINDTTIVMIPDSVKRNCDFTVELEPNEQTYFKVTRINDSIEHIAKIQNKQDLFIYTTKEYRNPNKKFFKRLFTWDWKKDEIDRYEIVNSNPLLEITETRIINIQ